MTSSQFKSNLGRRLSRNAGIVCLCNSNEITWQANIQQLGFFIYFPKPKQKLSCEGSEIILMAKEENGAP